MTQEDKQLLLKDLSARLPYGVQVSINDKIITTLKNLRVTHFYNDTNTVQDTFVQVDISGWNDFVDIVSIKPYLRPMSSMTEEERKEFIECAGYEIEESVNGRHYEYFLKDFCGTPDNPSVNADGVDWLNAHHFDYRGLINKGLALESPEDMYKEE